MVRTAFVVALLALLALGGTTPATAHAASPTWWFWLSRPESHGSRKLAGDFTHARGSYRYHSRERHGLFAFLHRKPGTHNVARHPKSESRDKPRRMTL